MWFEMKRARGVEEVASAAAAAAALKHSSAGGGGGVIGIGGGIGVASGLEYRPSGGLTVGIGPGQPIRPITSKEMPGSVQFGAVQAQQQYTGAIVMPTAAPSAVKVSHFQIESEFP